MSNYLKQVKDYYEDNEKAIALSNWKLIRKMTLVYVMFLVFYYFYRCIFMGNKGLTSIILFALILQLFYSAVVYLRPTTPTRNKEVDFFLIIFGGLICFCAMIMETIYTPDTMATFLPLVLVLMGQIYSINPIKIYILDVTTSIVFLCMAWIYKSHEIFYQDFITVFGACIIAFVCTDIIMHQRLEVNKVQQGLQHLSQMDLMTGLYNKVAFEKFYDEYYCGRGRVKLHGYYALAVIDIDDFKQVNDIHGHYVGDEVLIAFANLLKSIFVDRKNVVIGRFGGDEFIVLMRNQHSLESVQKQFDQLIQASNQMGIHKFGFPIGCSIGGTITNTIPDSFASYFISSDHVLYMVKNQNGNKCRIVERSN